MKPFFLLAVLLLGAFGVCSNVALAQSAQGIQVSDLAVSVQAGRATYTVGELIDFSIDLSADAFVYVFQFDSAGNVTQLLPNLYAQDNFLGAGQHRLPGSDAYEFVAAPPSGTTVVQVVAASQAIDFGGGEFIQPFPDLGTTQRFQPRAEAAINGAQASGTVSSAFASFLVAPPSSAFNVSPTASFNYFPGNPSAGQQVTFDASRALDPDGSIAQFQWDFNEDGLVDATGPRARTSFSRGSFLVTLTVTDDQGAISRRTKTIEVGDTVNQAPIAAFTEP